MKVKDLQAQLSECDPDAEVVFNISEPELCYHCSGSGEGQYDGTTCRWCKGKGELVEGEEE